MTLATIPFPVLPTADQALSRGLCGLMEVDGGPTAEQQRVFTALATHLLGQQSTTLATTEPLTPNQLAEELVDSVWRRLFLQMAIILDLCRHPKSEAQLKQLETYAEALRIDPPQLEIVRDFAHLSAAEATAKFIRMYDKCMPELSEHQDHQTGSGKQVYDDSFFEAIERLAEMPYGSGGEPYHGVDGRRGTAAGDPPPVSRSADAGTHDRSARFLAH